MRDWGRSDDDQRHRLVVNGTVNTSMAPATTTWERHQPRVPGEHDAAGTTRRCRSTSSSGVANLQGTTSRPLADGVDRRRRTSTCGRSSSSRGTPATGSDFFTLNLRVSRAFRISGGVKLEGLVEAFNLTNRVNNLTRNNTFGPGCVSVESACRRSTRSRRLAIRERFSSACGSRSETIEVR